MLQPLNPSWCPQVHSLVWASSTPNLRTLGGWAGEGENQAHSHQGQSCPPPKPLEARVGTSWNPKVARITCAQEDPLGAGGQGPFPTRLMLIGPRGSQAAAEWAETPSSGSFPVPMAEVWLVKAGTLYARAFFDLPLRT